MFFQNVSIILNFCSIKAHFNRKMENNFQLKINLNLTLTKRDFIFDSFIVCYNHDSLWILSYVCEKLRIGLRELNSFQGMNYFSKILISIKSIESIITKNSIQRYSSPKNWFFNMWSSQRPSTSMGVRVNVIWFI